MKSLPERGRIGIFNRSYYEDVLVVKVHPEWLGPGQPAKPDKHFWEKRYEDIDNFEKHLSRNGTLILKFFLHVSKDEQKRRFLERLTNPGKHWKFSEADLQELRSKAHRSSTHPVNERIPGVFIFRTNGALLYFNTEHVRDRFFELLAARGPEIKTAVFFLGTVPVVDMAGVELLTDKLFGGHPAGLHRGLLKIHRSFWP